MKERSRRSSRFVLCLNNRGYVASLIVRRAYKQLPDAEAEAHGLVRVVDESGEDYLFPRRMFADLELPAAVRQRLAT